MSFVRYPTEFPPLPGMVSVKVDLPEPPDLKDLPEEERRSKRSMQLEGEEGAKWFTEHLKASMRNLFRTQGEILPMLLVLAQRELEDSTLLPEPSVIACAIDPTLMNSQETKDGLANWISAVCARTEAFGWAFVSECWSVEGQRGRSADDVREGHESLSTHPRRIEVVMVSCQHYGLKEKEGQEGALRDDFTRDKSRPATSGFIAEIKRGFRSNGKPRVQLGDWMDFPGGLAGRFSNCLPRQNALAFFSEMVPIFQDLGMTKHDMIERTKAMVDKFEPNDPRRLLMPLLVAKLREMDIK